MTQAALKSPLPPAPPRDARRVPGKLGDFEITGPLGEGGSGVVYAAYRKGEELALKVLRPDLALSPKEISAFLREAERMRLVQHPSLIALRDAGILPDGRPFVAMPRLDGETLAESLEMGPYSLEEAMRLFEGLAGAVETLHEAGLVHRDIKPENIFVEGDAERIILLDLGIAREIDAEKSTTTQAGMVRGTPAYMAPERFFGARASLRSDIYELAVILYMMLTGCLPWDKSADASERLSPISPRERGAELPEPLSRVLLETLSPNPSRRPASVKVLLERVLRAARGEEEEKDEDPVGETVRLRPPLAPRESKKEEKEVDTFCCAPTELLSVAPTSKNTTNAPESSTESGERPVAGRSIPPPETRSGARPKLEPRLERSAPPRPKRRGSPLGGLMLLGLLAFSAYRFIPRFAPSLPEHLKVEMSNERARLDEELREHITSKLPNPMPVQPPKLSPEDLDKDFSQLKNKLEETRKIWLPNAPAGSNTPVASSAPVASAVSSAPVASAVSSATASKTQGALPECEKLVGLYCSARWKRTDNGMLCTAWQNNLSSWQKSPKIAYPAYESGCKSAYAAGTMVLKERERQIKEGIAPSSAGKAD